MRIKTRSPFIIYKTNPSVSYANISIRIYTGDSVSDKPTEPTIFIIAPAINREVQIEISKEVSSFFEQDLSSGYETDSPWCEVIVEMYSSNNNLLETTTDLYSLFDGYTEFEDGVNYQGDYSLMQSNTEIITNDLEPIKIPVDTIDGDVTVSFYYKGELKNVKIAQQSTSSEDVIQYITNSTGDYDTFSSRVLLDDGVIEAKKCLKDAFDDAYRGIDVDFITISSESGVYQTIKVKEIEECKYTPYKITFKNKFGAWQDLWMFKRSDESIKTKSESYKNNLITSGSYSTSRHQYRTFNKLGRKKIKISSGFYPESYNQVFEELNLSEYVYITVDNFVKPVNLSDGEFQFKKNVNDKLINYTVSLEYSFDAINTVK